MCIRDRIEGFSFRVTSDNGYDQTFKTDKNGEIFIEGLRIGEYTVSEVNDSVSAGYILPADKQATVKVGATTIVEKMCIRDRCIACRTGSYQK